MENLHLSPTKTTPLINFNASTGILELTGRSIHENPVVFYEPILQWLHDYTKSPAAHTTLIVKLEYFNTTSSKCLLDVFKKVKEITLNTGNSITIKWKYSHGDEDIKEAGEDYETIIGIPFEFIEEE
ncbi:MAG: DUF1987 domain-containing protein [Bacteroidia bacterium]